jgi:dipeptidyl-peptidase-4
MRTLASALLFAATVWAQKKPITLEALSHPPVRGQGARVWAPDGKSFAFQADAELKIYDAASQTTKPLIAVEKLETAAVKPPEAGGPFGWTNRNARTGGMEWSDDGRSLIDSVRGDVFLLRVASGEMEQITKTRDVEIAPHFSPDGKKVLFRRGWDLYAVDVSSKKETRLTSGGTETLRNGGLDWVYPEEIGLDTSFWWSPDSKWVAYLQFDTSREPLFPHADFLGVHAVFEPERYPQAGENNATVRLGVVPAAGGPTRWIDAATTTTSDLLARAGWMPDSRRLYLMRMNRMQNQLEALAIDIDSGNASSIFRESDPYWINLRGDLRFVEGGKRFLWTSERDGYRHVYLYSSDGKEVQQITRGEWEVSDIAGVDESGRRIFYTASEPSHLERHLYVIGFDGRNKRRLTEEPGTHQISMGPGGSFYLDTFSNLTTPPRTLLHGSDGSALGVYREADRRDIEEYDVLPVEIVQFHGADGTLLYGRLIRPAGYQPGKKYPVVVNVYGGPDVALPVRNAWPGIDMDQVLAHHGYVVWQAENRGGAGRGHAFETVLFHNLGAAELADQVAGVRHLISLGVADQERIGIRGHSYGGFMTVNALLNAPDVFRAGFAGAPVTSWIDYDTIYTERYMGLPQEDAQGYRDTALPQHAANLKGKLMLVHNFEDDNVLFQNTLQLTTALQAAGKQFEMMVYSQKTHGITGASLRHENQLMLDFFDRALP